MGAFRDAAGREWSPRITARTCFRLKRELNVDMFEGISAADIIAVAYYACEDQAKERSVSFDDFAEAIDDTSKLEAVGVAITKAVEDFFRQPPKKKGAE